MNHNLQQFIIDFAGFQRNQRHHHDVLRSASAQSLHRVRVSRYWSQ